MYSEVELIAEGGYGKVYSVADDKVVKIQKANDAGWKELRIVEALQKTDAPQAIKVFRTFEPELDEKSIEPWKESFPKIDWKVDQIIIEMEQLKSISRIYEYHLRYPTYYDPKTDTEELFDDAQFLPDVSLTKIRKFAFDVIVGIGLVHNLTGEIHGDLKLDNVLIRPSDLWARVFEEGDTFIVADFGMYGILLDYESMDRHGVRVHRSNLYGSRAWALPINPLLIKTDGLSFPHLYYGYEGDISAIGLMILTLVYTDIFARKFTLPSQDKQSFLQNALGAIARRRFSKWTKLRQQLDIPAPPVSFEPYVVEGGKIVDQVDELLLFTMIQQWCGIDQPIPEQVRSRVTTIGSQIHHKLMVSPEWHEMSDWVNHEILNLRPVEHLKDFLAICLSWSVVTRLSIKDDIIYGCEALLAHPFINKTTKYNLRPPQPNPQRTSKTIVVLGKSFGNAAQMERKGNWVKMSKCNHFIHNTDDSYIQYLKTKWDTETPLCTQCLLD